MKQMESADCAKAARRRLETRPRGCPGILAQRDGAPREQLYCKQWSGHHASDNTAGDELEDGCGRCGLCCMVISATATVKVLGAPRTFGICFRDNNNGSISTWSPSHAQRDCLVDTDGLGWHQRNTGCSSTLSSCTLIFLTRKNGECGMAGMRLRMEVMGVVERRAPFQEPAPDKDEVCGQTRPEERSVCLSSLCTGLFPHLVILLDRAAKIFASM